MKKGKIDEVCRVLQKMEGAYELGTGPILFAKSPRGNVVYCGPLEFIACVKQKIPEVKFVTNEGSIATMVSTVMELNTEMARIRKNGVDVVCIDDAVLTDLCKGRSKKVS